ncbi:MAG: beta-propeller domain-containing protein [Planctomycetes bacterium]|nr:beta-propeller domain-containing protein [Planctomycetota bacterium]
MFKATALQFGRLLAVLALPLLLAGCPWFPGLIDPPPLADPELKAFASQAEFMDYFRQEAEARLNYRGGGGWGALPLAVGEADTAGQGAANGDDDASSYSTTNIQEAGVDEGDILKSDGAHFYIAKGTSLRIVQAAPSAALAEVGALALDEQIAELYLYDGKLIVLARAYSEVYWGRQGMPEIAMYPPYYPAVGTVVYEVDISDPAAPTIAKRIELDGMLVESRLTNQRLILVLTIVPELPPSPDWFALAQMTVGQVLPMMRSGGAEQFAVAWDECLYPADPDGYYMTAVVTLDADDVESKLASVGVMAEAGTIYASTEALYLTDTDYDYLRGWSRERTAIHKLGFDDQGVARYVASGAVAGRLLNQFSLGEYEGYLRVGAHVTEFSDWWVGVGIGTASVGDEPDAPPPGDGGGDDADDRSQARQPGQPYNAVYVLGEGADGLEIVGALEDLAPGERIYAARFLGPRGFLVTFRQIDPLFALDLSDPTNPQNVGELKIPGYSDYLHPVGETHLIGVGRSTMTTPWGGMVPDALQLSLFDVTDLANPSLVQQIEVGGVGSFSEVSQTHKAFTFLADENLLALPAALTPESTGYGEWAPPEFDGVLCYRVDPASGFTALGQVAAVTDEQEPWYYYGSWRRAAFINDVLYAISADGVRAASLSDFTDTTAVTLAE